MASERLAKAKKLQLTKPGSRAAKQAFAALSPDEKKEFDPWLDKELEKLLNEAKQGLKAGPK